MAYHFRRGIHCLLLRIEPRVVKKRDEIESPPLPNRTGGFPSDEGGRIGKHRLRSPAGARAIANSSVAHGFFQRPVVLILSAGRSAALTCRSRARTAS